VVTALDLQLNHANRQTNIQTATEQQGLVTSYDSRPGNGERLFLFWRFINLSFTYLDTYSLTYSPGTHMVAL